MIQLLSKYKSYLLSFLVILGMIFTVTIFASEPTRTLSFQGQLFDNNAPLTSNVNATFTFYDAPTDGNITGTPVPKVVTVSNGYFGVQFTESDTTGVDFNQQLYIEVSINGTTLSPRTSVNPTVSSLKSFGTFSYTSAPSVGPSGSLYFNTMTQELYVSNGSSWQLSGLASSTTQWVANGTSLNYMAGNVGIGTSSPANLLHLYATSNPNILIESALSGTGSSGALLFKNADGVVGAIGDAASGRTHLSLWTEAGTSTIDFFTNGQNKTSGVPRLRINSDGDIGIGSSTPSAKFTIVGTTGSSTNIFLVASSSNAKYFTVASNGNVGINSATTSHTLTLDSNGYTNFRLFNSASTPNAGGMFIGAGSDAIGLVMSGGEYNASGFVARSTAPADLFFTGGYIQLRNATGTTPGSTYSPVSRLSVEPTGLVAIGAGIAAEGQLTIKANASNTKVLVLKATTGQTANFLEWKDSANTIMGALNAAGSLGIGTSSPIGRLSVVGTSGSSTDLFVIASSTGSQLFNVASNGNVGIGTTIPYTLLDIAGSASGSNVAALTLRNTASNANASVSIDLTGTVNNTVLSRIASIRTNRAIAGDTDLVFSTYTNSALTEKMRIMDNGNVGIGTNAPSVALDISNGNSNGTIRIGGDVNAFTQTASTRKIARIVSPTYTAAGTGTNISLMGMDADGTNNTLEIGGFNGSSLYAATGINFSTASTTSTAAGTVAMRINGTGNIGMGVTPAITNKLHIRQLGNQLRLDVDASNGLSISSTSTGATSFTVNGTSANFSFMGGNVGIGTTTPGSKLTVAGAINSTDLLGGITTLSVDASGNIIRTPSDQKLKTNVETLTSALDKVNAMRGVSYNWIDTSRFGPDKEIGFIAQELETIVPEVVKSGGEYKSVNYQNLTALLTEAIKELSAKFDNIAEVVKTKFVDTDKVKTKELCIGDTCITEQEFKQVLQNRNTSSRTSTPTPAPVVEETPAEEPAQDPVVETPVEEPTPVAPEETPAI